MKEGIVRESSPVSQLVDIPDLPPLIRLKNAPIRQWVDRARPTPEAAIWQELQGGTEIPSRLGHGYNSISISTVSSALPPPPVQEPALKETTNYQLSLIRNKLELTTKMSLAAHFAVSGVIGSAEAKLHFAKSVTFRQQSVHMLIHCRQEIASVTYSHGKLSKEAIALLQQDASRFLQVYGDKYINVVKFGGELIVVVEFFATTEEALQSLSAQIDASSGAYSAWAKLAQATQKFEEVETLDVSMYRSGSSAAIPDWRELMIYGNKFSEEIKENYLKRPSELSASYQYNRSAIPDGVNVPQPPDLDASLRYLEAVAQWLYRLQEFDAKYLFVLAAPEFFTDKDPSALVVECREKLVYVRNQIARLDKLAQAIVDQYWKPLPPPADEPDFSALPLYPFINKKPALIRFTCNGVDGLGGDTINCGGLKNFVGGWQEPLGQLQGLSIKYQALYWSEVIKSDDKPITLKKRRALDAEERRFDDPMEGKFGILALRFWLEGPLSRWFKIRYRTVAYHWDMVKEDGEWAGCPFGVGHVTDVLSAGHYVIVQLMIDIELND